MKRRERSKGIKKEKNERNVGSMKRKGTKEKQWNLKKKRDGKQRPRNKELDEENEKKTAAAWKEGKRGVSKRAIKRD